MATLNRGERPPGEGGFVVTYLAVGTIEPGDEN
jgi:hypothetical protein